MNIINIQSMMNFLIEACPKSLPTYGFIAYNHCMGNIQNFRACYFKGLWHISFSNAFKNFLNNFFFGLHFRPFFLVFWKSTSNWFEAYPYVPIIYYEWYYISKSKTIKTNLSYRHHKTSNIMQWLQLFSY